MSGYVIRYSTHPSKYLIIHNPEERFFLKMEIEVTDDMSKATHFDDISTASYVNERCTYQHKNGIVVNTLKGR